MLGSLFQWSLPNLVAQPQAFTIVAMAAFFTATVRAPLVGVILVAEMTDSFPLLLPMLVACFAALVIPTYLRNPPIYDSLRERALRSLHRAGLQEVPKHGTPGSNE
jgi:CIC family chloride channel protein